MQATYSSEPDHQLGPTVYIGPRKLFGRWWGIVDIASWDAQTRTNLYRRVAWQVGDEHARRICTLLSVYSRLFGLKRALLDRVPGDH